MPEPLSTERTAEIRASIERAHTEICEVASEGAHHRFRMSIPANPGRDTDLIVSEALNGAEDLLAEVDRHKAETGGVAVAEQEPMRIAPTVFMVETEENVGATLVRMTDPDGREVYVGLDDHMRDLLVSMLVRNDGAADADPIAPETLAEIRRRDEIGLRLANKLDGSLDEAEWDRSVLLAEVDRLNKAAGLLGSHLQGGAQAAKDLARVIDVTALEIRRAVRLANAGDHVAAMNVITEWADEADWLDSLNDEDNFHRPSAPTVEQEKAVKAAEAEVERLTSTAHTQARMISEITAACMAAESEAGRLRARVDELTSLLNNPDRLAEHTLELRAIYAESDAMDEADRLAAGGEL